LDSDRDFARGKVFFGCFCCVFGETGGPYWCGKGSEYGRVLKAPTFLPDVFDKTFGYAKCPSIVKIEAEFPAPPLEYAMKLGLLVGP
jgi:hypothetical protein